MPFEVAKSGSGYVVKRADTGKVKSHHASKAKANAAIRAIYANDPAIRHEVKNHEIRPLKKRK